MKKATTQGNANESNSILKIRTILMILLTLGFMQKASIANVIGVDPGSPTIEVFNEATWASVSSATLTMTGFTIIGAQAVTWNSNNLLFYAIVTTSTFTRQLVTVNPTTGVCNNIGQLSSTAFSSMTFNSNTGVLYAMGGSGGGTVSERLYSVDMSTAATTLLAGPFSVGTFGEVISYNYDDNMIYHWSGTDMEKIDPVTFVATTVTQSGAPHNEICGAVYVGGGNFVATDLIFQGATSAFTITSAGVASFVSATPYRVRGLGYVDPLLPVELSSFVSSVNGNNVTLNWATTTETNNSGFEIERSNVNGHTSNEWAKVGNVTGNGTVTTPHSYSFTDRNLASGTYSYRLKQIDFNGNFEYFNLNSEVNVGIPAKFELSQNYPNPFNPTTNLEFGISELGFVSLKVYNVSGKEVATLVNEIKPAGYYSVNFNASSLSSGIYYYTLLANNYTETKKMTLLK